MATSKKTALTTALDEVTHARSTVIEWETDLATATADQEAAEAARPASPQDAATIAQRRVAARERVTVAREALEVAQAAEAAARRAAVAAEADQMLAQIGDAQNALDAHLVRVAELRAPLEELTGITWAPFITVVGHFGEQSQEVRTDPRETELRAEVEQRTRTRDLLRRAASGDSLDEVPVDQLPAPLRADGILPNPRAVTASEEARRAAELAVVVAERQRQADAAAGVLGVDPPRVLNSEDGFEWAAENLEKWREDAVRGAADEPPTEFDVIALLCGPYVANDVLSAWRAGRAAA